MERREFLKILGFGAATVGALTLTMSPAQAASSLASASEEPSQPDKLVGDLAEANGDDGEFAQYYYRRRWRRPYYYRPYRRYYYRPYYRPYRRYYYRPYYRRYW